MTELLAGRLTLHRATRDDVPALVALLRDDTLGARRERADLAAYLRAFDAVDRDPAHFLAAVCDQDARVVGTFQLTLLPGLSRGGTVRLQVEGVRVAADQRGQGIGEAMLDWAHEWGRSHGATLAQLTSDRSRPEAHRFYEGLGYEATHEGYKRPLEGSGPERTGG